MSNEQGHKFCDNDFNKCHMVWVNWIPSAFISHGVSVINCWMNGEDDYSQQLSQINIVNWEVKGLRRLDSLDFKNIHLPD